MYWLTENLLTEMYLQQSTYNLLTEKLKILVWNLYKFGLFFFVMGI